MDLTTNQIFLKDVLISELGLDTFSKPKIMGLIQSFLKSQNDNNIRLHYDV